MVRPRVPRLDPDLDSCCVLRGVRGSALEGLYSDDRPLAARRPGDTPSARAACGRVQTLASGRIGTTTLSSPAGAAMPIDLATGFLTRASRLCAEQAADLQ